MSSAYSSADEFLDDLRSLHKKSITLIQSNPNEEFQEILKEKVDQYGLGHLDKSAISSHGYIVSELWKSVKNTLPDEILDNLDGIIAVGVIDNMAVNAFCSKSPEGYIAVAINTGLIALLNKLSKITIATLNPSFIKYCNRDLASDTSSEDLIAWKLEVCEHYRRTGQPLGPQIHLHKDGDVLHARQLHVWEMYILCHEIGHVLCNHLDNKSFVFNNPSLGMASTLIENRFHKMESEADFIGYILLRKFFHKELSGRAPNQMEQADDRELFSHLISLFDLFYLLGAAQSKSHPHPLDRLCDIALNVYGKEVEQILFNSYENHELLTELFKKPLITSNSGLDKTLLSASKS